MKRVTVAAAAAAGIIVATALIVLACCSSYYQAHGMSEETSRNITATITTPPGSAINSVSVTPLIPGVNEINFTGTWSITTNPKSVPTHDITGIPTITPCIRLSRNHLLFRYPSKLCNSIIQYTY
jgi:hypothetical protein